MFCLRGLPVTILCFAAVGCGMIGKNKPQVSATPPRSTQTASQPRSASPQPQQDAVSLLIAKSEQHYQTGERQLAAGHLDEARREFDLALAVIVDSPYGARSNARLSEQFDRLVERISAHETIALARGDGFTESPSEPALIDKVLEITTFAPPAPAQPAVQQAVEQDLATTAHDIPIPQNDRVLSYVELFQDRLSTHIKGGLERGSRYLPMIQDVFAAEGIPLDLAYVPLIESAFKPSALSRASARGVWQFMRPTANEQGLRTNWFIDERADPEKATRAAARYLKSLYYMFDDWHLALASYNGGPGRVQRAIERAGTSDFWELTATSTYLPRETREYVPMILAAIIIARNPGQYGFEIAQTAPLDYEEVRVSRAIDLRRVAEWSGASIDEIQTLNPELRRLITPLRDPSYKVKVPAGTGDRLRARLARADDSDFVTSQWHTVRRGESLKSVARRFRISQTDLAAANSLTSRSRLKRGQRLMIPRGSSVPLLASRDARAAVNARRASARNDGGNGRRLVYKVRRGDSLIAIARRYDVSVSSLRSWNRLRGSRVEAGDRLTIYRGRGQRSSQ
jgi:peptidoglycan lytic transglycosylase D